jgi:AraC family transcriptional regulator
MDFNDYLRSIGLSPQPEEADGIVLRHIHSTPINMIRPAADLIAMATPLRSLSIETRVEGRTVRRMLRHGDICLQPPMIELEMRFGATDMIAAFVPSAIIGAAAEAMQPGSGGHLAFRLVHKARDTLLSSLAIELCNEISLGLPSGRYYREHLGNTLVARLVKRYGLQPTETISWAATGDEGRIKRAFEFIDERLTKNIDLAAIARHVGVSRSHLSDLFKSATGESIWAHVRRRRLQHARDLLLRTQLTVAEVSERIGYASTPQFTEAFKSVFVLSPGAYRKSAHS